MIPAHVIPTRHGLLRRLARLARIAWLRWEISSAEDWIRDCERDGIYGTEQLREIERQIGVLRVRLMMVEAR